MMRGEFLALLGGLSPEAMFRRVVGEEIAIIDDPDQVRAALRS
ncbi:hypothetical protein AB0D09_02665 [Streptomyces sp. NPDC049097]